MWSPSLFVTSNRFYRTENNFGPLNGQSLRNFHGLSPWHQPCPVLTFCDGLWRHSGHRQDDCNCGVFTISDNANSTIGPCNINEWWRWHRSHNLARSGRNFVCYVTYLPIPPPPTQPVRLALPCPVERKWADQSYILLKIEIQFSLKTVS